MPSKLEQLKKEIKRLRPEIMELKFGCRFKAGENEHIIASENNVIRAYNIEDPCVCIYKKDITEILGRPITLEDVLAVLGIIGEKLELDIDREWLVMNKWWDDDTEYSWILGKPLDYQSEETINFLHSLIVN